jgi:hypothetical protein
MSADKQTEPVSFLEMKASVGSILFLWSSIERELAKRIEYLDDGSTKNGAHSVTQKIIRWEGLQSAACAERPEHQALLREVRERLTQALEIRNRIAHGLIGITADPFGHHGDARLETELNGEKRSLPHAELEHSMRVLSHLIWAIGSLSEAAIQKDLGRAEKTYAGIRLNTLP